MTFLPIVERELRVAARRRTTYWARLIMAFIAMLVGASVLLANLGASQTALGQFIFIGLAVLALVYCLASGRRSTADCLSEEKREGTLGLLFLTDLNGYDIVLGKLVATSLNAFYGLLAVFPVLAIPLLLGGITNGEFWRLVLVLLSSFLFSLAIGIFSSALSYDARRAMALNFALIFLFTAGLPALAAAIDLTTRIFISPLLFSSPIFCFIMSLDFNYKAQASNFWWSLGVINGLTWFLLLQASRIVPHSWQDKPVAAPTTAKVPRQSLWHTWNYGKIAHLASYRKKLLNVNAFYWLAARARLKPMHVWVFVALMCCWWAFVHFLASDVLDDFVNIVMAVLLNTTLKLWVTLEAGQRLAEDKKLGALELVLSTPLGVRDIIRGQMLALRRQFLAPIIFVILLNLYLMGDSHTKTLNVTPTASIWLGAIFLFVADLLTLSYVAMAKALTAKTHNQSILATVFYILMLPWIVFGMGTIVVNLWYNLTSPNGPLPDPILHLGWFFGLSLLTDVFFGLRARKLLLEDMRPLVAQRFISPAAHAEVKPQKPKKRPRKKRIVRYAVAAAVLFAGLWYFWPKPPPYKYPPPVMAPVSLSQRPLRVFPAGGGALFILPDGSLWRYGQIDSPLPKAMTPEQFGTNRDWVQVAAFGFGFLGLRRDGTIWQQSQHSGSPPGELTQADSGHEWIGISSFGMHSCALKSDGTLWAWGNNQLGQLGNGPGPNQTNLVQVGTNNDWAAVRCNGPATLALRTNGTLWAWGQTFGLYGNGSSPKTRLTTMTRLPYPTQICRETNWVGFADDGMPDEVRNQLGELWEPFYAPPNADLGASATCRLIISNTVPDHVAFAYCGRMKVFEIHNDGTLWESDYTPGSTVTKSAGKWSQAGKRSDWLSIWAGGGTAYGLTSDGTLWIWGADPNREPVLDFATRLKLLEFRIREVFGASRTVSRTGGSTRMNPQYEEAPRPLMQLNPALAK